MTGDINIVLAVIIIMVGVIGIGVQGKRNWTINCLFGKHDRCDLDIHCDCPHHLATLYEKYAPKKEPT